VRKTAVLQPLVRLCVALFDGCYIREVAYTATDHCRITRDFLLDPERHLQRQFSEAQGALSDAAEDDG